MVDVSRETQRRLDQFVGLVLEESDRQNLIAASTFDTVWRRHVEDSLQLLALAPDHARWTDIGSGAGFPGMVIALASDRPVTLIEPRRGRAEFLERVVSSLGLSNVTVIRAKIETAREPQPAQVISARAVTSLGRLFEIAKGSASSETIWLLPKGRSAAEELENARRNWQGRFRLVPSVTDRNASIVVATGVRRRGTA